MKLAHDLILQKHQITLLPLNETYLGELTQLATAPNIWQYTPESYSHPQVFKEKWFDKAMQQIQEGKRFCFVCFFQNKMIGSSSYYEIDDIDKKLNIGYTWIHSAYWGSEINPQLKLLMLEFAFEELHFKSVRFNVSIANHRSCHALMKLGIKSAGILKNHYTLQNGKHVDFLIFKLTNIEWPNIKKQIELKINLTTKTL